ncbi:MAG: hypothetical protein K8I30_20645 [Anaerolineae bacterium]|nr:hypothetical protein [Anaerolineae bacterium]
MPPTAIYWDTDEKLLMVAEFNQPWTWDEFHATVEQINLMINSIDHSADIIIWHKVELPEGNPIPHLSRTLRSQPANLGKTVIVMPPTTHSMGHFLKSITSVINKANPGAKKILAADTLDNARDLLARRPVGVR